MVVLKYIYIFTAKDIPIEKGDKIMEEIINRVVSIDKKASDILKQTEEYINSKEKDIRSTIENMKTEIMEKTQQEIKSLYELAEEEAENEADRIKTNTKEESDGLTAKFSSIREKLDNQLFSRIFK